jgi:hypothetical protein
LKVQLAYPLDDLGDVDDVVEVDDQRGRTMVREGVARLPDADHRSVEDLRREAQERGLDVKSLRSKSALMEALGIAPAVGGPTTNPGGED